VTGKSSLKKQGLEHQELQQESSISKGTTGLHSRHWALWTNAQDSAKPIQEKKNLVKNYSSVYNLQCEGLGHHHETGSSVATCTCAEWV